MVRKLLIRDLTLSDGLQKVLAARMSQEQISRLLPYYREAGFYAMEVWNGGGGRYNDTLFEWKSLATPRGIEEGDGRNHPIDRSVVGS